jgi:hypothetical protein
MFIDRSSFVLLVGSLAAGGVGGYFVGQKDLLHPSPGATEKQAEGPAPAAAPAVSTSNASSVPAAPVCDDSVGSPAACPAPGAPDEEGGCGALPYARCNDFKNAMKPRVAEHAVACLLALKPWARCDANRLQACGHEALMSACPMDGASTASAASDDRAVRCDAVAQACAGSPIAPNARECRETMTGLTEVGRSRMVECMRAHCSDKGLLGCEAMLGGS